MSTKGMKMTADYIPFDEFKSLLFRLHESGEYKYELYFMVSFATGLRVSDVLKLRWKDILSKESLIVTEQKTGKIRSIAFSDSIREKISTLHSKLSIKDENEYIMSTRTGSAMDKCNLNKKLKEIQEQYSLSIDHFSTHSLRKTFGRYVYETNNKSEEALILLSQIFNHSSIAVTRRYIGITTDEIKNVYGSISI